MLKSCMSTNYIIHMYMYMYIHTYKHVLMFPLHITLLTLYLLFTMHKYAVIQE